MTTRIYQSSPLKEHSTITLDEFASHHLARVLRANVGDAVIVFNGQGGEYAGVIQQITKKSVIVDLREFHERKVESPLRVSLAQGISRGEKMDYTIQKAVELGVVEIFPLFSERCNVKLDGARSEKRLEHWRSVVISAAEQSGRTELPEVTMPQSLEKWLPLVEADFRLILSPHTEGKLKNLAISPTSTIVILIGPEGGLSPREMAMAMQHQFLPINLGPRVLRTETAGLAAIAALQALYGDLG